MSNSAIETGQASAPAMAAAQKFTLPVKYNAPKEISLGTPTQFQVEIESSHPVTSANFRSAPGEIQTRNIPKVSLVLAQMSGPNSDLVGIHPESRQCQHVTDKDNPIWDWDVTPKSPDSFVLVVDLYEVSSCDSKDVLDHRIDSFPIKVKPSILSWLLYVWPQWKTILAGLFGLIGAGGGAFGAWAWLRNRSQRAGGT